MTTSAEKIAVMEPATENTSAAKPESSAGAVATSSAAATAATDRNAVSDKRRALGRGLDSLLPGPRAIPGSSAAMSSAAAPTPSREGGGVTPGREGGGVVSGIPAATD